MPFLVDIRDVVFRNRVFDSQFKKLQSPVICIYTGAEDWEGMTDHLRNNQMLFATEDKSPAIRILDRRFNKTAGEKLRALLETTSKDYLIDVSEVQGSMRNTSWYRWLKKNLPNAINTKEARHADIAKWLDDYAQEIGVRLTHNQKSDILIDSAGSTLVAKSHLDVMAVTGTTDRADLQFSTNQTAFLIIDHIQRGRAEAALKLASRLNRDAEILPICGALDATLARLQKLQTSALQPWERRMASAWRLAPSHVDTARKKIAQIDATVKGFGGGDSPLLGLRRLILDLSVATKA